MIESVARSGKRVWSEVVFSQAKIALHPETPLGACRRYENVQVRASKDVEERGTGDYCRLLIEIGKG